MADRLSIGCRKMSLYNKAVRTGGNGVNVRVLNLWEGRKIILYFFTGTRTRQALRSLAVALCRRVHRVRPYGISVCETAEGRNFSIAI